MKLGDRRGHQALLSFPRHQRRGRIETEFADPAAGDGIKVSPGINAGGGLKHGVGGGALGSRAVSPGINAGGGLKQGWQAAERAAAGCFPRHQRRGRIETMEGTNGR